MKSASLMDSTQYNTQHFPKKLNKIESQVDKD